MSSRPRSPLNPQRDGQSFRAAAGVPVAVARAGDDAELIALVRRASGLQAEFNEANDEQDGLFGVCAKFW
jgi:hypothetical protein